MNESKMKIFRMTLGYEKDAEGNDIPEKPIKAPLPVYSTSGAACFDIYSANIDPIVVEPKATVKVPTGMKLEIAEGYQLKLQNRSGMGTNHNVQLAHCTGTVDSDYRGEVFIPLYNRGTDCFIVEPFMRVCQGEIVDAPQYGFTEVESEDELSVTERGDGRFGSTGLTDGGVSGE